MPQSQVKNQSGPSNVPTIQVRSRLVFLDVTVLDKEGNPVVKGLGVEINEDKSRMVDLKKGESFTFLVFEYRRVLSLQRK